jgi:CRP-like cAMP-binding protein
MPDFITFCNQISPLTKEAVADLEHHIKEKSFEKGDYILTLGNICRNLYFIEEGLVKSFFNKEDKEFIMRFFPENTPVTILDSFVTQTPSAYSILALEPTMLSYISQTDLNELCKKHHCVESFHRKLLSIASINMMKRVSEMLEENGTERYHHFVKENNHLLQRISLGDLANYIGISQVSVSRIRAKK